MLNFRLGRKTHIPILMYHQIGGNTGSGISVSIETFTNHMQLLKNSGYHSIPLEVAAQLIESQEQPPCKSFVITFDDGFKNIFTHAYPIMQQFGFTATVFLVADFMGSDNDWSENVEKLRSPLMGVKDIYAMPNFTFGSHTLSHRHLTYMSEAEAAKEIISSRTKLEDKLGIPITSFCYPYGDYNKYLMREVKEAGYSCACSTRKGNRHRFDDRFCLKRIPVTEISLKRFKYRLNPLYDWEHRE